MKIAFLTGKSPFDWNENSLISGNIGGTEKAVIKISAFLAKEFGCSVYVFNDTSQATSFKHGKGEVVYSNFKNFSVSENWSHLFFLDFDLIEKINFSDKPVSKYFWVHNIVDDDFYKNYIDKFDKFLLVSNWHKKDVPDLPDNKALVVENGVDYKKFSPSNIDPFYCINTSSVRRGLETLVFDIWPKIERAEPKAEMHWFSGWNLFDWSSGEDQKKEKIKKQIDNLKNFYSHGRVPPSTLAKKFGKANLWLYPTEFKETCCISALEAQSSLTYPITTNVAALKENVEFGLKLECKNIYTNKFYQQKFADKVVEHINEFKRTREKIKGSRDWVKNNKNWNTYFNNFLKLFDES